MDLFTVDAFTDRPGGGNRAGVALMADAFPPEGEMLALARELGYSETVFSLKREDGYALRYFTPTGEIELCGHATCALFHVLYVTGAVGNGTYAAHTLSGKLDITVEGGYVWMGMGKPCLGPPLSGDDEALLYAAFGLSPNDRPEGLRPAPAGCGITDIMMPVTEDGLELARMNRAAVTELSLRLDVVGVHMFCIGARGVTARCRNFAPLWGIDEEAATGTSNASLTWYLCKQGLVGQETENIFLQGEALGRPSMIKTRLRDERLYVGGNAVIVTKTP